MGRPIWTGIVLFMAIMIGLPLLTGFLPLYRMVNFTGFSPLNTFGGHLAPYAAIALLIAVLVAVIRNHGGQKSP